MSERSAEPLAEPLAERLAEPPAERLARARCACIACGLAAPARAIRCAACGDLLEVTPPAPDLEGASLRAAFEVRRGRARDPLDRSGVWRYRELVAPDVPEPSIVTLAEGSTPLYESRALGRFVGLDGPLLLKHEGMNPTGSFKDRGMTVGVSVAAALGMRAVACASTGNTSASLAAYAARAGMVALVLVPASRVAYGKLAQALAYGARVVEVEGGFDDALRLVEALSERLGIYLLNSVNPWRVEGQKAIALEVLDDLAFAAPDWVALPAGNLGNTSAIGKGLREAQRAGLFDGALPRLLAVQAAGASPFARYARLHREGAAPAALAPEPHPETVATAIRIGDPRSWRKAWREIEASKGRVEAVADAEVLEAKAAVDAAGIGCEPASAAPVAGVRRLVREGAIARDARVVCILTGHVLKDPEAVVRYHTAPAGDCDGAGERGHAASRRNPPWVAPSDPAALERLVASLVAGEPEAEPA